MSREARRLHLWRVEMYPNPANVTYLTTNERSLAELAATLKAHEEQELERKGEQRLFYTHETQLEVPWGYLSDIEYKGTVPTPPLETS